jgi:ferredoxin
MKVYLMELMCIGVYACFAAAGFYFAAKERLRAAIMRGPRFRAQPALTIEESEQPQKAL